MDQSSSEASSSGPSKMNITPLAPLPQETKRKGDSESSIVTYGDLYLLFR